MTNPNTGHGHVFPRPDGAKAKCGGPVICSVCAADLARQKAGTGQTATTPASEPLPCPFCGQRARLFPPVWVENFSVACIHCEAEGPHRRTGPEAIEAWNRRASPAQEPRS